MSDITGPASALADNPFTRAEASAAALCRAAGVDGFDAAVVLGSGWLAAADAIGTAELELSLADIGGFKQPSVPGHTPSVRFIRKGQLRLLVFLGRIHLFEGHDPHAVAHGVRTAITAGCRVIVLTNAAGGINADYTVGQPVLISDHINLTGRSPLWGPLPPGVPSRFTDLTEVYSRPAARPGQGTRSVAGGGRLRRGPRAPFRDAGRDQDAARRGRGPRGHVHRHGGHRRPSPRRRSARHLHGQQPGGWPVR